MVIKLSMSLSLLIVYLKGLIRGIGRGLSFCLLNFVKIFFYIFHSISQIWKETCDEIFYLLASKNSTKARSAWLTGRCFFQAICRSRYTGGAKGRAMMSSLSLTTISNTLVTANP